MTVTFPPQTPKVNDPVALRVIAQAAREALKGNITFQGNFHTVPVSITHADSPYNVVGTFIVLADASAGGITINLPPAEVAAGYVYAVKKSDSSGNAVTIDGDGSETIDGATTSVISTAWGSRWFVCDGTAWFSL